ncbi:MAG: hypothetical protein RMJ04_12655, partial [Geminicoccaceae bacterium]|nr:hypothetical protein [Geminicoccaceae bacterium]
REVLDGLLGLNSLRDLAERLRTYATNRRGEAPVDKKITDLENEVASLTSRLTHAKSEATATDEKLVDLKSEQTRLFRELEAYGSLTQADVETLELQRADIEKQKESAHQKLLELAISELPFALIGPELRQRVEERIKSEDVRERWLTMRDEGRARIEQVLAAFRACLHDLAPPLTLEQEIRVEQGLRSALDRLWYPPPEGIPDSFWHDHLSATSRASVIELLGKAGRLHRKVVEELLQRAVSMHTKLTSLMRDIEEARTRGPSVEKKYERLRSLTEEIERLHNQRGALQREIDWLEQQLKNKHAELARLTEQRARAAKALSRAAAAERVAQLAEEILEAARPLELRAVAQEMTKAIRAMAHRRDHLARVELSENVAEGKKVFELRLLDAHGHDIRRHDLSAGEKQIFTQALFAAAARLSKRRFPLVIDTPLGRLDEQHRLNVLKFLTDRDGQVILLSSDTEVVGPYLEAIRDKVIATYTLQSEKRGEYRVSKPVEGYFAS